MQASMMQLNACQISQVAPAWHKNKHTLPSISIPRQVKTGNSWGKNLDVQRPNVFL